MHALLLAITRIIPVSEDLQARLLAVMRQEEVRRNQLLLKAGDVARRIYFIEAGLVRSFYSHHEKELTSWFMKENDFIISVRSFLRQVPAEETMQVLEDTRLWSISFDELQGLYTDFLEFNVVGRILTEHYYIASESRAHLLRACTAAERYAQLLAEFPTVLQRVSLKHIASYLAVSPETLSRLRARP